MRIKNVAAVVVLALAAAAPLASQDTGKKALKMPLQCAEIDCPLLTGAPQTAGMRSGFVRLKPWEAVGWHTTGDHEEVLVILRGSGEAQIEGREPIPIAARTMVYIPPMTRHNVQNKGRELLEYVYVVAPTPSH
ncbi:MAG TPA: cupin domain-containing protein [Candidatus Acidoferrum sp.]|nr:cupin domain-containing protein [Candidatus Acidoferrum sp.]